MRGTTPHGTSVVMRMNKRKLTAMIEENDTLAAEWADAINSRSSRSLPRDPGFILLDNAGLLQASYQFEERLQDGNEYDDLDQRIISYFSGNLI